MTFELAHSPWPRYGYDQQNSSSVKYRGPTLGRVLQTIELPHLYSPLQANRTKNSCVIAEDGSLRVLNQGCLSAWSPLGKHLWTCEIPILGSTSRGDFSLPVILKDGRVLFHTVHQIFLVDNTGLLDPVSAEINQKEELISMMLDDSGFSPNLTRDGQWVFSTIDTGLLFLQETEFRS